MYLCDAIRSTLFLASRFAPISNRTEQVEVWPFMAAQWRGAEPIYSFQEKQFDIFGFGRRKDT